MIYDLDELGLLDDEDIELDFAALALSALDHEGLDLAPYHDLIDEIADRLEEVSSEAGTLAQRGEALKQVLGDEYGFIGDVDGYDAPVNADMIRVLDRRQGLPVSLSILYVAAARRMGWSAWALNTPGHVLVRLGQEQFMLLDPFHGGKALSQAGLEAMVRQFVGPGAEVQPEYLDPIPNRIVLVRLLTNQASRAAQGGDNDRALAIHERMVRIAPEFPDVWLALAELQVGLGDKDGARASLHAMLEVTRDKERRRTATELLERLAAG
ncbi:MAG: tetratricopeptide repeat protein [Alphaproteobacteria bacterium]|nr:tetratricopeptide repeat protein [Alphaproteobacteria bacterium]